MDIAVVLIWCLCLSLTFMLTYLSLEIFLGLLPLKPQRLTAEHLNVVVMIPAHDEEIGIGRTIANLRIAAPEASILVVADNCTDETAVLAAQAGAEIIERFDKSNRGKGYALAFGRDHLRRNPPDAVVVLDADCKIQQGGVTELTLMACANGCAVQAANLVVSASDVSPQVAISNFAIMVKNLFRARGMSRIGTGALLFGTGMAFPWKIFESLPLATDDSTEDIKLGLHLVRRGESVLLADHVRVTSPPPSLAASRAQRKRWEHGFLSNMVIQVLPMWLIGLKRGSRRAIATGCHMAVLPLALLIFLSLISIVLFVAFAWVANSWAPTFLLSTSLALAAIAILAAWLAGGREVLRWSDLRHIPRYVLWKLPIYSALFGRRQTQWNRTTRED